MKIAVDKISTWIFVTGEIRGGTTFVGKVLSLPTEVDYIHEPFNLRCGIPGMTRRYLYVRPTLDSPEMKDFHERARTIFTYDFRLQTSYHRHDSIRRKLLKKVLGSRGPFHLRIAKANPFHTAAVIKDPTAAYATEYLFAQFNVLPVIVLRHPTSFIASLRRINWWPKATDVIKQQSLWEDFLVDDSDYWSRQFTTQIQQAAAHWRLHFKVLLNWARKHPEWIVVKLEDLSRDPVRQFTKLYQDTGLSWSRRVERRLLKMTQATGRAEVSSEGRVQDLTRDSNKIFELRRNSLTADERRQIFDLVKDVALPHYSEDSFLLA